MAVQSSVEPGFRDPVGEAQSAFRIAMNAMARPGQIMGLRPTLAPPPPLLAPAAALLLALCDFETPVWLDPPLTEVASIVDFLRFHTGAGVVAAPEDATYAVISNAPQMPPLAAFAPGTPEYPDRSATLVISVHQMSRQGWTLQGPGIHDRILFSAAPVPHDLATQIRANRLLFPRGVDMFFVTETEIAALPRSVSLTESD